MIDYRVLRKHEDWLNHIWGGKRADLTHAYFCGADLRGVNLRKARLTDITFKDANLRDADLRWADLSGADLSGSDLRGADLHGADLCDADLSGTNLKGTNLSGANLIGAILPVGIYQVVGAGSHKRYTTYDSTNDQIICGCWDDEKGNHLDSFIAHVEGVYGQTGYNPNVTYYTEYMSAIAFFKAMKELNKEVK